MGPKYDTPTLLGVYRSPPYLHDGRAKTLLDVLTTANRSDRHGKTSHLTKEQLDDLVAFLKSLPYETPPDETPNTVPRPGEIEALSASRSTGANIDAPALGRHLRGVADRTSRLSPNPLPGHTLLAPHAGILPVETNSLSHLRERPPTLRTTFEAGPCSSMRPGPHCVAVRWPEKHEHKARAPSTPGSRSSRSWPANGWQSTTRASRPARSYPCSKLTAAGSAVHETIFPGTPMRWCPSTTWTGRTWS